MIAKVGGILKGFTIHRKDGTVERYDKPLHNLIANNNLTQSAIFSSQTGTAYDWTAYVRMVPCTNRGKTQLVGVYSQSGNTLTRVSGDYFPENGTCIYVWENQGTPMQSYAGNVGVRTVTVSQTVTAGTDNLWMFRTDSRPNSGFDTITGSSNNPTSPRSASYSNGVFTIQNTGLLYTVPAAEAVTIKSISFTGANSINAHTFDLPSDVLLNIGDQIAVGVGDLVVTWSFDAYAPRAFGSCPISGITTSCVIQRCFPFFVNSNSSTNEDLQPTRIWLIDTANKYTLPTDIGLILAPISPTAVTLETIVATGTTSAADLQNNFRRQNQAVGTIVGTRVGVKQIAWGNTSQIFGIIEFDTPQTLTAGKVLTVGSRLWIIQDLNITFP